MKTILFLVLSVSLSFLFLSCASSSFESMDTLKDQLKIKEFPEQKDYPEADALVLSDIHDIAMRVESKNAINVVAVGNVYFRTEQTNRIVVKLFKNIDKYADERIYLWPSEELLSLHARTIKPDGTIIELRDEDFHTIKGAGPDAAFYPDFKEIRFTYPGIEKNCIVEYEYKINVKDPFVRDKWEIQSRLPKLQSIYRLQVPVYFLKPGDDGKDHGWKFKAFNCSLKSPVVENNVDVSSTYSLNTVRLTWEQKDIPAFEPDPVMEADENYVKNVKFIPAEWESWSEVSKYYYGHYFKPQLVITDEITNKAKELTRDCRSEIEKIESLYKYVQCVPYVDLSLGLGGYKPHTPNEVLKQNSGDCKDKAILLLGLLKSINIEAKPVLVLTSDKGLIHTSFPNWTFNHMIVKVTSHEKADYWMDPTSKYCKFGSLPYGCQNINVLVLNDDKTSQIELTPVSTFIDNSEAVFVKLDLTNPDSAYFDIGIKFKGTFDIIYKNELAEKTHDEIIKICKSLISDKYLNAEILHYSINNLDSANADLKLNFRFRVPNIIEKQAELNLLNGDVFSQQREWQWLSRESRHYDIKFNFPYSISKVIEIILPENKYAVKSLPSNMISTEQGINFSRDINFNGNNRIVENEIISIANSKIGVQFYKGVKDFFDKVKRYQNERIILTSK